MARRKPIPAGTDIWLCPVTPAARTEVLMRLPGTLAAELGTAATMARVTLADGRTIDVHADQVKTTPPTPSKPRHGARRGALDPKSGATETTMFE